MSETINTAAAAAPSVPNEVEAAEPATPVLSVGDAPAVDGASSGDDEPNGGSE